MRDRNYPNFEDSLEECLDRWMIGTSHGMTRDQMRRYLLRYVVGEKTHQEEG